MRALVFPLLVLWLLIALPLSAGAAQESENPYDALLRQHPELLRASAPQEKTLLERITEKAIIGAIAGAIFFAPFGIVRLVRELRAIKKQRGYLVTYRTRLLIAGCLLWFMLITFISYAFDPNWDAGQFDTILFGPPVIAVISALLWGWVKKVKPPA